MCPSTESSDAQSDFAADVLRNLLRHVDEENERGSNPFLISHAWTEGPFMYLVYKAPPSEITWGLARDTRESIIDPSPWTDLDEAVRYYYLLDLDENRMSASFRHPGNPDTILWLGDTHEGLPERPLDIPDSHRRTQSLGTSSAKHAQSQDQPIVNVPRRYADPL